MNAVTHAPESRSTPSAGQQGDLMNAIAINPEGSLKLLELPRPVAGPGEVLLRTVRVGVCATDREMVRTKTIFTIPPGERYLILGHEGLAEVAEVGPGVTEFVPGERVVPTAYRRCEEMALPCRVDMCPYGRDRRAGINTHGMFAHYIVRTPEYLVKAPAAVADVAQLLEPLTVSLKGFTDANVVRQRWLGLPCYWRPEEYRTRVLVVGVGPIGMLGVFVARAFGWETVALDIVPAESPKAELVRAVGAAYISSQEKSPADILRDFGEFDIIAEAVQDARVLVDYGPLLGMNSVFVILGWGGGQQEVTFDLATFIRDILLTRQATILASTGAGTPHYHQGMRIMQEVTERYGNVLERLVTHRYPVSQYEGALTSTGPDQIKAVIDF